MIDSDTCMDTRVLNTTTVQRHGMYGLDGVDFSASHHKMDFGGIAGLLLFGST